MRVTWRRDLRRRFEGARFSGIGFGRPALWCPIEINLWPDASHRNRTARRSRGGGGGERSQCSHSPWRSSRSCRRDRSIVALAGSVAVCVARSGCGKNPEVDGFTLFYCPEGKRHLAIVANFARGKHGMYLCDCGRRTAELRQGGNSVRGQGAGASMANSGPVGQRFCGGWRSEATHSLIWRFSAPTAVIPERYCHLRRCPRRLPRWVT